MSFGRGGGEEVLRATYALEFKDVGLSAATRADGAFRESIKRTSTAVAGSATTAERMSTRQSAAWRRAADVASQASRRTTDAHIQSQRRIDSSITKTVSSLRKMGTGYEEIGRYLKTYRADAEQTALAIERSSAKEIAAMERVERARSRLRGAVGLSPHGRGRGGAGIGVPGLSAEDRSIERGLLGAASSRARLGASSLGGGLVGGLAAYLGVSAVKDAARNTADLAKQATVLSHYAGLSQQTALEFAAVSQAYGVSSQKLGMAFRTLGTQVNTALTKPTESSTKAFRELGISHDEVKAHAHDLSGMLGLVADHLNKMPPGAQKTADASKLLGRSWQTLLPLLLGGSKGMNEQLDAAKKLGVQMGGDSAKNAMKLHESMVLLKIAQAGVEIQFTEHILPALLKMMTFGLKVYEVVRKNLGPVFHFLGREVHDASKFLHEHKTLLHGVEIAVTALVSAWAGLKVISLVTRLVRGAAADFRNLAGIVSSGGKALFQQRDAESILMKSNAELAASNVRLAESFDAVGLSAKGAAGGEVLARDAGMMTGTRSGLPINLAAGGSRMTGTRSGLPINLAAGGSMMGKGEAGVQAALAGEQAYGAAGMLYGPAGGRMISSAAGDAAKSGGIAGFMTGAKGVGSKLLGGAGIAGMGLLAGQMIGGVVPGRAGSALGAAATGAGIGAGLGSVIPGIGTLAGGLLGGALGGLTKLTGGGPSFDVHGGRFGEITSTQQLGEKLKFAAQTGNVKDLEFLGKTARQLAGGLDRMTGGSTDVTRQLRKLSTGATRAASALQGQQLNRRVGGLEQDLATSRFKPSADQIGAATQGRLTGLPAQMQRMGAEAMIKFTAGLERNRKLPTGTTDKLIADLQKRYGPLLASRLNQDSANSMKVISDNIKQSSVIKDTQGQIDSIHKQWALLIPEQKVTSGNFNSVVGGDMKALEKIIATSTGKQRAAAVAAYAALRHQATAHFSAMAQTVDDKTNAMSKKIKGGSADAVNTAAKNFGAFAGNITGAMNAGVLSTSQGIQMITDALNKALTALGGTKLSKTAVAAAAQHGQIQNTFKEAQAGVSEGAIVKTTGATGVRVPGPVGPDSWTLVDPAGRPAAMVGGGEILVANRHTEARVDDMLSYFGTSLGDEVAGESRMHSYARGGRLRRFAGGGRLDGWRTVVASAEDLGGDGYRGNPISPFGYSELSVPPSAANAGSALGHLPYLTHMRIRAGAREVVAAKQDIGAGSSFNPVMGIYPGTREQLGLSGGEFHVAIERADGVPLTIGAGVAAGAAVPTLKVPGVRGTGAIADTTRAGLKKVTDQANRYLQKKAAALSPAGGGGVGGGTPFSHGKYTFPLPKGSYSVGRVDQGWDLSAPAHTPEFALAAGTVIGHGIGGFGPWAPILKLDDGNEVYYGHAGPGGELPVGTRVKAGQVIGEVGAGIVGISTGPHLEIGFYPPGGMGAGAAMKSALGYARGGRIPGFGMGGATDLGGGWIVPGGSGKKKGGGHGHGHHRHAHPRHAHPRHPRAPAVHEHWNPLKKRWELATSAQAAAWRDAYIKRYGHVPPSPPRPKKPTHAATVASDVGLSTGFDLGYQFGLDPTQGTDYAAALAAAIQGVVAFPKGAVGGFPTHLDPIYPDDYPLRVREVLRYANERILGRHVHGGEHSGATVSRTLGAAGLVRGVHGAGFFRSYGKRGPGRYVSVLSSPHEALLEVGGRYLIPPGRTGGPAWTSTRPSGRWHVRHPPGLALGGILGAQHGHRVRRRHHHPDWARDPTRPFHVLTSEPEIQAEIPVLAHPATMLGIEHPQIHATAAAVAGQAALAVHARGLRGGPATHALRGIDHSLGDVESVTTKRLDGFAKTIREEIKTLSREKHAPRAKKAIADLRRALSNVDYIRDIRDSTRTIDSTIRTIARGGPQKQLRAAMTALGRRLEDVAHTSYRTLQDTHDRLVREMKHLKPGSPEARRLSNVLQLIDYAMGKRIGTLVKAAEDQAAALAGAQTRLQNLMTRQGIDSASSKGAAMMEAFAAQATKVLRSTVSSLQNALAKARKSGDKSAVADITTKLTDALAQLDQAVTDQVTARYAAITGAANEAITNAQKGAQRLADAQTIAGTAGSGAAQAQTASFINQSVLPALRASLGGLQAQLTAAVQAGDSGLQRTITDAIDSTTTALAQATSDLRTAIEGAAQAAVASATHASTMADTGLQALQIQQGLAGTTGTLGAARQTSDYITANVIPALQNELAALKSQQAAAQSQGDQALADQIAEATAAKQNEIEQKKLDALDAIKQATQATAAALAELGGNLGVSYGGQSLPDLTSMLNGA